MTLPDDTDEEFQHLNRREFRAVLQGSDSQLNEYVESSITRLHRIFAGLLGFRESLTGPVLDIASGGGILYRAIKRYCPELLPYSITEVRPRQLEIDGEKIQSLPFECDRGRIPLEDNSVGTVLFLDVLEHLLIDPMWTLIEINRTLKPDGHVIISTPNAAAAVRLVYILGGVNPGRDIEYKPTGVFERHNREWTVTEVEIALKCAGFDQCVFTTFHHLLDETEKALLDFRDQHINIDPRPGSNYFGPQIFFIARKKTHRTLEDKLPLDTRWPALLYSKHEAWRRRPKKFPIFYPD